MRRAEVVFVAGAIAAAVTSGMAADDAERLLTVEHFVRVAVRQGD